MYLVTYAVIFRATTANLDALYLQTASKMRQKAMDEYGCLDFVSVAEGKSEIAISYWPDLASIQAWKTDPEHQLAQSQGRQLWYENYQVEVVEVLRQYTHSIEAES